MPKNRTRRNKENANYGFLVSWKPDLEPVKWELKSGSKSLASKISKAKKADILAQEEESRLVRHNVFKSLRNVGFTLVLELMIYLAWNRFT